MVNYQHLGNKAFAEKKYYKALEFYQKAKATNNKTGIISYDIGVTYYRLGEYENAEKSLVESVDINPRNSLAFLNLGLSQVKLNKLNHAKTNFRHVLTLGASQHITEMANTMLNRIETKIQKSEQEKIPFILSAQLGYQDETETLTDRQSNSETDAYLQLMGIYYHQFNNDYQNGYGISLTAFSMFYDKHEEFNLTMLAASIDKSKSFNTLLSKFGAEINQLNLGGSAFQLNSYLFASLRYPLNNNLRGKVKLRGGYSYALDDTYKYLNGGQFNLYSKLGYRIAQQSVIAKLEMEHNTREGVDSEDLVSSQSPRRIETKLEYEMRFWRPWEFQLAAAYRYSRYPGRYQSASYNEKRVEKRKRFTASVKRRLSKKLSTMLEWEYTNNDSSIETYDVSRNQISLGLEYIN